MTPAKRGDVLLQYTRQNTHQLTRIRFTIGSDHDPLAVKARQPV
jgi:hypothetical protein